MPYVRRSVRRVTTRSNRTRRSTRPRRTARRYTRRSAPSRSIRAKWENPLAKYKNYVFKYMDSGFTLAIASAAFQGTHVFRGNSLYDPDYTGAGVQPYGFDQVGAIYKNFTVYASKITIYFNLDTITEIKAFLMPSSIGALTYSDQSDLRAVPYCKSVSYETGGGASRHNKITHYSTTKRMWPLLANNDAGLYGTISANPSIIWYWILVFDGTSKASTGQVRFDAKIKYYCKAMTTDSINESTV